MKPRSNRITASCIAAVLLLLICLLGGCVFGESGDTTVAVQTSRTTVTTVTASEDGSAATAESGESPETAVTLTGDTTAAALPTPGSDEGWTDFY